MSGKTYTEKQLADLFQAGISRGLILYGMVMHGQTSEREIELFNQVLPDFKGSLKKIIKK